MDLASFVMIHHSKMVLMHVFYLETHHFLDQISQVRLIQNTVLKRGNTKSFSQP